MKHVAAYLLCVLGGNATPTAADVQAVLKAGDIEADTESLDRLIKSMEGKSIDEVLEAGKEKLSKFGGGGGGGGRGRRRGRGRHGRRSWPFRRRRRLLNSRFHPFPRLIRLVSNVNMLSLLYSTQL